LAQASAKGIFSHLLRSILISDQRSSRTNAMASRLNETRQPLADETGECGPQGG